MDICPPVAILPGQNSTYTPVRKTGTTSYRGDLKKGAITYAKRDLG